MDAIKTLRDLQYRIDSTPENDPERGNAVRVRDRLLAKFNLTLDDIRIARQPQAIENITRAEAGMLCQFLQKQFGWEEPTGESSLDWASVLSAAVALDGLVFPTSHLNEEQKQLPSQV